MPHIVEMVPVIVPGGKGLFRAVCSCGQYRSGAKDREEARKAFGQHVYARMLESDERRSRFQGQTYVVSGEMLFQLVDVLRELDRDLKTYAVESWQDAGLRDQLEVLLGLKHGGLDTSRDSKEEM